jgi:hypothetical protein
MRRTGTTTPPWSVDAPPAVLSAPERVTLDETEGESSKWVTFQALRVLEWWT